MSLPPLDPHVCLNYFVHAAPQSAANGKFRLVMMRVVILRSFPTIPGIASLTDQETSFTSSALKTQQTRLMHCRLAGLYGKQAVVLGFKIHMTASPENGGRCSASVLTL